MAFPVKKDAKGKGKKKLNEAAEIAKKKAAEAKKKKQKASAGKKLA